MSKCLLVKLEKRLPTRQEVMRTFFANLHASIGTRSSAEAAKITASQLITVWEHASIPTKELRNIVPMIEKNYQRYRRLVKDKHLSGVIKKKGSKLGDTHEKNREDFVNDLHELFDIAHKDALQIMTVQEDIDFYKSMKSDRKYFMDVNQRGVDKKYTAKQKRKSERLAAEIKAKERSERLKMDLMETRQLSGLSDFSVGTSSNTDGGTDDEFIVKERASVVKVDVLNDHLVTSTLARTSTSTSAGSMMVKAIVQATVSQLGLEPEEVRIVDNDKKADRLPVLVSGIRTEQLLGAPELSHGSGECIAAAVVGLLKEWELEDRVMGLVFDTTSSNSGRWGGACALIQQKLSKDLLELACRHHIYELLLWAVFDQLLGSSKTPDFMYGDYLKKQWAAIDKGQYKTLATTRGLLKFVPNADQMIKFCIDQLQTHHPRDDYKELLELMILFLGGSVPDKATYEFRKPGATSKTRWMAKALYAYKIWMFSWQLNLTDEQRDSFFKICTFLATFYVKCPVAVKAPALDLELLRSLSERKEPHLKAAFQKLTNHLWYLSERLVCFALFDESVSLAEKRNIVKAMKSREGTPDTLPRATLPHNKKVNSLKLRDFASQNSPTFFTIAKISPAFLEKDPSEWTRDADYIRGLEVVQHMLPVNDLAERGVALMKKYLCGNKLTNNEDQRQYILQVVERHRKMFDKYGGKKMK
ncbi:Alanine racemase, catabolic [Frankliniella fusca]|uniref:Alanine racemase, catabolic n=1 Tax=Frankliniella fusca TaxID=407009 RepID=A0AAE1H997_9NEOP|nr:Alanine racemase, catabolic [Frankliniella fusca]